MGLCKCVVRRVSMGGRRSGCRVRSVPPAAWAWLAAMAMILLGPASALALVDQELIQVLQNFDVVNNTGTEVNDFEITFGGGVAPADILQSGSGLTQEPWTNAPYAPFFLTGWIPPTIATGPATGETTVKWGPEPGSPPSSWLFSGSTLHFGVTLLNGRVPEYVCMHWTFDGQPVYSGGNPNMPLTITPDPPIYDPSGNLVVRTVNQVCGEGEFGPEDRWIQRYVGVVDRSLDLHELVMGDPVLDLTSPADPAPILLTAEQSVELVLPTLSTSGSSGAIVWYDVFTDDNGAPANWWARPTSASTSTPFRNRPVSGSPACCWARWPWCAAALSAGGAPSAKRLPLLQLRSTSRPVSSLAGT